MKLKTKLLPRANPWNAYPLGTKAHAITGGFWIKMPMGWKWNGPDGSGGVFPTPGGDACGNCLELPAEPKAEPDSPPTWRVNRGGNFVDVVTRGYPSTKICGVTDYAFAELLAAAPETARQRDELVAIIARSNLEEVDGYTLDPKDRKPTLIKSGERILVPKDNLAREQQRAKDLQAHAATARKLAWVEKQRDELLLCMEMAVRGYINSQDDRARANAAIVAAGGRPAK